MDEKTGRPIKIIKSYEARALKKRSLAIKIADRINQFAGSVTFLILNIIFFSSWIALNSIPIAGFTPPDPFPFPMLTTMVSLEAIMLAIFVLMSQNRQSVINSIRDEMQLQVNLVAEKEITKILMLMKKLSEKHKIKIDDPELLEMLKVTDIPYIERHLEKQLSPANDDLTKFVREPFDLVKKQLDSKK